MSKKKSMTEALDDMTEALDDLAAAITEALLKKPIRTIVWILAIWLVLVAGLSLVPIADAQEQEPGLQESIL